MPWLRRSDNQYVERASPSTMKARFPSLDFIDENGHAASNDEWIWNPDLSAVTGFASKYWITQPAPDEAVTLMDQAARDAVDAAEEDARLDTIEAELDNLEDRTRLAFEVVLDEFNRRSTQLDALLVGMNNQIQNATNLADLKTRWATFTAAAQSQAIPQRTFDDFKAAFRAKLRNGV